MKSLGPAKALIFRITHIENVPWILDHGVQCRNSDACDPNFREIGNPDLIGKRTARVVPIAPGGTLSDYVPFYFTPFSPMLFNIRTGYGGMRQTPMSDIVILVSSLRELTKLGIPFLFTDRHAYLSAATYFDDVAGLDKIDWKILRARDFKRDTDDLGKVERYQAEALVHGEVPVPALAGLVCHGEDQRASLEAHIRERELSMRVVVRPGWYF